MKTLTLTIPAMQTEALAMRVGSALDTVDGVDTLHITLAQMRARIGFDEMRATPQALRTAILRAGFDLVDDSATSCCGGCGG
jgi:copper chaperone CopZ